MEFVCDAGFEQCARFGGVVEVIFEWIFDGFGHDDAAGEVHDGLDVVVGENIVQEFRIGDVAFDEGGLLRGVFPYTGNQAIEDDNFVSSIEEFVSDVASDVSGSAGDEDFHGFSRDWSWESIMWFM